MNLVARALCASLTNRSAAIDWAAFTEADWRAMPDIAVAEGLLPLLWRQMHATDVPSHMPEIVRRELQLRAYQATAQSALIYGELARMLAALNPALPVVVLKGAALGPTLYSDPSLRPLSDIDLLVHTDHLEAVTATIRSLGYEAVPELTPGINQRVEYHTRLEGGPRRSVAVELHWRLVAGDADWRSPPSDWFWQHTEVWQPQPSAVTNLPAPSAQCLQLTPSAELLYLAAHAILQHGAAQARTIWFYDLHLLLTRAGDRLHWPTIIAQAREFRWAAAVHVALEETQARFGKPVPAEALDALREGADAAATQFVRRKAATTPSATGDEWIKLMALEPRARLRFVASLILPSPTYLRWRYQPWSRSIWPAWYGYHWFRIVRAALLLLRFYASRRLG